MYLELKPLKKEFWWQPNLNIFYKNELLENLIIKEKLNEEMILLQDINFDSTTKQYFNVKFLYTEMRNQFIFYIKDDDKFYWAYVIKEKIEENNIIYTLQIDIISSNLSKFENKKFKGLVYIERSNNFILDQNLYHSNICNNYENKITEILETNILINKKIDTFITRNLFNYSKVIAAPDLHINLNFKKKGTIFVPQLKNTEILAFDSLENINDQLPKGDMPLNIDKILKEYFIDINKEQWNFPNEKQAIEFLEKILYPITNPNILLRKINSIIEDENNKKWISIPKIFEIGNNLIENFELDLTSILKNIDLKNHIDLHKNYFLALNNLFKIPLDLLQIKKNKIFGTRLINMGGVKFSFFYYEERNESFYDLDLALQNGLNNIEFKEYTKNLDLAYNQGMKGLASYLPDILQNAIMGGIPWAKSQFSGKGGDFIQSLGIFNLAKLPFNSWKDSKIENYEKQKILNKPKEARQILLYEAVHKIMINNTFLFDWVEFDFTLPGSSEKIVNYGNTIQTQYKLNNKSDKFVLIIETLTKDNVENIEIDQKLNGNIVNKQILNYENILNWNNINDDHLFFQGKIQPSINPVDSFMLNLINDTLSNGIKILKEFIKDEK